MAKPAGPACNLRCDYCFYREKERFFQGTGPLRMPGAVLDAFTRDYIDSQPGTVTFGWQGGEPTLAGVDFFQHAVDLQKKYAKGRPVFNALQTNGTLIDETWCSFLSRNRFLVGLSLDGPAGVHDVFRRDKAGRPTSVKVLKALDMMLNSGIEVNVLATVNSESARQPKEVYNFFRAKGVRFIQFVPVVERLADPKARRLGLPLAVPPSLTARENPAEVTPWSVGPEAYGRFLTQIFDEWLHRDVGRIFVMNFEWTIGTLAGVNPGVCYLYPRCGRNMIMEHNGDVYSCDHFMYPSYRLGNILKTRLGKLALSSRQTAFGASKETSLPGYCRRCGFLSACRGGCPKHRFVTSPDGEAGLNYFCSGFKEYFRHVAPTMKQMISLLYRGLPASRIMDVLGNSRSC